MTWSAGNKIPQAVTVEGKLKDLMAQCEKKIGNVTGRGDWNVTERNTHKSLSLPPPPDLRHFQREEMRWSGHFKTASTSQGVCASVHRNVTAPVPNAHLAPTSEGRRAEHRALGYEREALYIHRSTEARALAVGVHPAHEARLPRRSLRTIDAETSQYTSTTYPPRASSATRTSRGTTRPPHAHTSPPCAEGYLSHLRIASPPPCTPHHTRLISHTPASHTPTRRSARTDPPASTHSDLHRCIGAHFPCYLTAPTSHRVDAARLRKPAIEPRHRIAPKDIHVACNSALSLHARHQSRAISSPSPKHAHGALPGYVKPGTHVPATITDTGTHARLSPANGPLAISAPGYPGRTQPVAPAPHTGTRPCAGQRAAHTRTAAAAPAPDGAEVVPSQGRMKIRRGHALTRRLTDSSFNEGYMKAERKGNRQRGRDTAKRGSTHPTRKNPQSRLRL
ncbi:hypothetical protein B0H13DRAFT_1920662 [Mycena leptocephala]|nr:hypothetical protein B0H13DRAFT_1920662 [Mycena leptocephala]